MKKCMLALVLLIGFLAPASVWAGRAAPFKGIYNIVSQTAPSATQAIFLLDNDTVGALWARYAEGELPADLEPYRNEQAILAGFNNRDLIFFTLERGALILDGYLALQGGAGEQLELRHRPDGQYDLGVKEKGQVSLYLLAPPQPLPEMGRN